MTAATSPGAAMPRAFDCQAWARTALKASVAFWYLATVIGQVIFVAYVLAVYGGAVVAGDLAGWNKVMPHGYVPGDSAGNVAIGVHLLMAAVIMLGGALQLLPALRARAPRFHRWNGRIYLAGAAFASVSGLYMIWFRGTVGDVSQHIGTSVNALLILAFAAMALKRALGRDFAAHRRWALRLFLSVSGVWFFRVGLMFWIAVNGGPAGFDPKTFTGPFLTFLAFGQYLVPLGVLQLYLACRERGTGVRLGMAVLLFILTLGICAGVAVATMGMWLPRM
jgi:hypothetical protein